MIARIFVFMSISQLIGCGIDMIMVRPAVRLGLASAKWAIVRGWSPRPAGERAKVHCL